MSVHPIPSPANDPADSIRWARVEELKRLCRVYLREPTNVTDDGTTLSLVFTPDLTVIEAATLNRLVAISAITRITPTEWEAIEPDLTLLRTYAGTAVPTLTQTATVTKSIIRVLRALLRD
jgi:hypothetical protein